MTASIVIHTDGSCLKNPEGPGGCAFILELADGTVIECAQASASTTNNRMEMQAAINALQVLESVAYEGADIELVSDSQYVVKGATEWIHGWKRRDWVNAAGESVANRDLWRQIDDLTFGKKISWKWVRGHAGHAYNEHVDKLASRAAREQQAHYYEYASIEQMLDQARTNNPRRIQTTLLIDTDMSDDAIAQAVREQIAKSKGRSFRVRGM